MTTGPQSSRDRRPLAVSSASPQATRIGREHPQRQPTARSSQPLKVVYVHGMGPHEPAAVVKKSYDIVLFGRELGDQTALAYYADILHPEVPNGPEIRALAPQPYLPAAEMRLAERGLSAGTIDAQAEWSQQLWNHMDSKAHLEKMADDQIQLLIEETKTPGMGPRGMTAKILPPFPFRSQLTEAILKRFIPDVAAYFFHTDIRQRMQQRLRDLLLPGCRYVIVAHSLGTILSFEVLSELGNSIDTPLVVTLGSPLGIDEVQEQIEKLGGRLQIPPSVKIWHNFADRLDPVALDRTLADDYQGGIRDHLIWNLDTVRFSGFNPHSATGYLAHPEVRNTVLNEVKFDFTSPIGSSILTRDLAGRMADADRAVDVLIEIRREPHEHLGIGRDAIVQKLMELAADSGQPEEDLGIEKLQRFVAARLTGRQIRILQLQHQDLQICRMWRNSEKRILLTESAQRIHVPTARAGYGATGKDIGWAVLDTGINPNHPHFQSTEFGSSVAAHWDCTAVGAPVAIHNRVSDNHGHGTHVAGIIAGQPKAGLASENGGDCLGIAPRTSLHIYKVLRDDGGGSDALIIKALDHIASVNDKAGRIVIHGVNLSLGGPFNAAEFGCGHSPLCSELRRLWQLGVLVCVAAGNEGQLTVNVAGQGPTEINFDLSIGDPANLEEAIAVGSVHKTSPHLFGPSYFSSRGPTSDGRHKPDVVAPGEKIKSCNSHFTAGIDTDLYVEMSGTSMACPHVSGMLAGFLSVRPEYQGRPDEVKRLLMAHAMDLGRSRDHQGAGLPNLIQMLANT